MVVWITVTRSLKIVIKKVMSTHMILKLEKSDVVLNANIPGVKYNYLWMLLKVSTHSLTHSLTH